MKEYNLNYYVADEPDSVFVPFDNEDAGRYSVKITNSDGTNNISIILDKKACSSFANLFAQLSKADLSENHHLHLDLSTFDEFNQSGIFLAVSEDDNLIKQD